MSLAETISVPNTTVWKNETDQPCKFKIFLHPKVVKRTQSGPVVTHPGFEEVIIPPGKTVRLRSEFDQAIQRVEGGVIMGGLAPRLTKIGHEKGDGSFVGAEPARLHDALDPTLQARKVAEAEAEQAQRAKQAADDAFIVSQNKRQAAEAAAQAAEEKAQAEAKAKAEAEAKEKAEAAAKAKAEAKAKKAQGN